jgi:integrase
MLLTFLRVGEAITLVWSDVDFEKRTLRVNKSVSRVKDRSGSKSKTKIILTTPKTIHGDREVVLTDEAIQTLNIIKNNSEYTRPKDYIFSTAKGTMVTSTHLYKVLKGVLKAANLNKDRARDKFTLHYLRHTGISFYIRNGVPIDIVSSMAGHADTSITRQIYYHIIKQQREEAMTKMNAIKI